MQTDNHKKSFDKEIEEEIIKTPESPQKLRRMSTLGGQLSYTDVRVTFPFVKESTLTNYMVYKVHYVFDGVEYTVDRRFSDFVALRETLKKQIPCHFIFPAHKKQAIVS